MHTAIYVIMIVYCNCMHALVSNRGAFASFDDWEFVETILWQCIRNAANEYAT